MSRGRRPTFRKQKFEVDDQQGDALAELVPDEADEPEGVEFEAQEEPEKRAKTKSIRRGAIDANKTPAMLAGGDRAGAWFWERDLLANIESAKRYPADTPQGSMQNYQRTGERETHPWSEPEEQGVVYRWREPEQTSPTGS